MFWFQNITSHFPSASYNCSSYSRVYSNKHRTEARHNAHEANTLHFIKLNFITKRKTTLCVHLYMNIDSMRVFVMCPKVLRHHGRVFAKLHKQISLYIRWTNCFICAIWQNRYHLMLKHFWTYCKNFC